MTAGIAASSQRLKARRNWLALEFDINKQKRLWATWRLENEKYPLTKVIHPV